MSETCGRVVRLAGRTGRYASLMRLSAFLPATAFLAAAALLVACTTARTGPLPTTGADGVPVVIFCDGFHSGLLIAKADWPGVLDPAPEGAPNSTSWSVHFGEMAWMRGEATDDLHALSLFVRPQPGGVQVNHTDGLMVVPLGEAQLRTWTVRLPRSGIVAMEHRLRERWITRAYDPRLPGEAALLWVSPLDWSIGTNCHDFTVDLLIAGGIPLRRRMLTLAGGLSEDLDEALAP
jgi:hypothetical protein